MKPPLVFLHVSMLVDDPVVTWPELGRVHVVDAEEELKTYDSHGMAVAIVHGPCVVSLPEGSEHALKILDKELSRHDVLCVSVRREPGMWMGWLGYLEYICKERGVIVVEHNRHDVIEAVAERLFRDALRMLEDSAGMVRSEAIEASEPAMRTEKALSKAIEVLNATGFRTPRAR